MGLLRNRFTISALVIGITVGLWNLYVTAHAHGIVSGRVVNAAGQPVAGAVVHMYERDFVSQQERGHTSTDAEGAFHFTSNASHVVQLEAESNGAHSPRAVIRLWFRAQDTALEAPLRIP